MSNQEQRPPPSGLGAVLAIVQAVVAIVPRWLVVATGVIFLAWLGLELYQKAQQVVLQTGTMAAQKLQAEYEARVKKQRTDVDTMIVTPEQMTAAICGNAKLRRQFGEKEGCPPN